MTELMAQQNVGAVAAADRPTSTAPQARGKRAPLMSVALHLTLVIASLIAMFPIVWVILSSFKPGNRIQSTDLTLVDEPTLEQLRARADPDELPGVVPQLGDRRRVHHGDRRLHLREHRLCPVPVQLPRSGASSC